MEDAKQKLSLAAKIVESRLPQDWDESKYCCLRKRKDDVVNLAAKRVEQVGGATDKPVLLSVRLPGKEIFLGHTVEYYMGLPPALSWTVNPLWAVEAGQRSQGTRLGIIFMISTALLIVFIVTNHLPTGSTVGQSGLGKEARSHWILLFIILSLYPQLYRIVISKRSPLPATLKYQRWDLKSQQHIDLSQKSIQSWSTLLLPRNNHFAHPQVSGSEADFDAGPLFEELFSWLIALNPALKEFLPEITLSWVTIAPIKDFQ